MLLKMQKKIKALFNLAMIGEPFLEDEPRIDTALEVWIEGATTVKDIMPNVSKKRNLMLH